MNTNESQTALREIVLAAVNDVVAQCLNHAEEVCAEEAGFFPRPDGATLDPVEIGERIAITAANVLRSQYVEGPR